MTRTISFDGTKQIWGGRKYIGNGNYANEVIGEEAVESGCTARLWETSGNARYYLTNLDGKQVGYYDVVAERFVLDIQGTEAEKLQAAFLTAFAPKVEIEAAPVAAETETLVGTYVDFPCAEESDELSATTVGVFQLSSGRTIERVLARGAH